MSKTLEKLKEYIESGAYKYSSPMIGKEEVECCIEALEKQMPKKVIDGRAVYNDYGEYSYDTYKCPYCSEEVFYDTITYYCETCGQHLDWSEADED